MRSLLLILFLLGVYPLWSQKFPFVTYSTEEGLPQSQVTAFAQDEIGYLWIGTLGGLARYGGEDFITFSSKDGLLNSRISSLDYFDETLWIGHDGGISYMRHGKFRQVEFSGSGNDRSRKVSKILRFKDKILVCSIRGGLFEFKKDKLIPIPLSEDYKSVRGAYEYNGTLFLATSAGVLSTQDGKNFKPKTEFGKFSFSGITGHGDVMFFATFRDGCVRKNMRTGKKRFYSSEELVYFINDCYYDRQGQLWLRTANGIILIEPDGTRREVSESNGLPVASITCFFQDASDNLWIGSAGKGMFRFPKADFLFYDVSSGFPSDLYLGGFHDRGIYYFATYDKGVFQCLSSGEIKPVIPDDDAIWCSLKNIDGKHWFGGESQLSSVDRMTGEVKVYSPDDYKELPGWKITALYKVSKDKMYIGGNDGVALYDKGTFRRIGSQGDIGTVRDFEIVDGKLYCVTNLGLFELKNGEFTIAFGVNHLVYNIELDHKGRLWFGGEEGLRRIRNGKIERIDLLPDAGSNFIDFLYYRDEEMYVGTNNGLFVLTDLDADNPKYVHFGVQDGLVDLETNLNSGFFDAAGDFWFGTASGLVRYHPENKPISNSSPRVKLASILVNYEQFDYSKYATSTTKEGIPKGLKLPYSMNNLVFEFEGVSLKIHGGLRYQFLVEGLNENWSPPSESPTITLTSVPPGNYVLRVRCLDHEELYSEEFDFPFEITSPFYLTWWFILISILVLGGFIVLAFRFRLKRIAELNRREMLEYKSRLLGLEQKSMNASMNRHFIFNALNSIQYFINTQNRTAANKYLTNFAKLIRKNLDSVTVSGNVISLEEEIERIELYLSLESMRFNNRFDYEIRIKDVDPDSVLIPPMLIQPFIENSIIHGILPNEEKKGKITIDVFLEDEFLNIRIEDNGIGIHNSMSKKLAADGDHRSQGMEITSKRIELIRKISDNGISMEGPEELVGNDGSINGTYVLIKITVKNLDV